MSDKRKDLLNQPRFILDLRLDWPSISINGLRDLERGQYSRNSEPQRRNGDVTSCADSGVEEGERSIVGRTTLG